MDVLEICYKQGVEINIFAKQAEICVQMKKDRVGYQKYIPVVDYSEQELEAVISEGVRRLEDWRYVC